MASLNHPSAAPPPAGHPSDASRRSAAEALPELTQSPRTWPVSARDLIRASTEDGSAGESPGKLWVDSRQDVQKIARKV